MNLKPLTKTEADQLTDLLKRAIANDQFQINVASPLQPGDPDEFGDGDRHDGNGYSSTQWKVGVAMASGEDPETGVEYRDKPEVKLLVDDAALCSLVGVTVKEAEQIVSMRG